MVTIVSPHLVAVGATWDDRPGAGRWIADRLGPFGPSVGHAVPLGYPGYAVVPIPAGRKPLLALEALLAVLGSFTGDQPVHSGMGGLGLVVRHRCRPAHGTRHRCRDRLVRR